MIGHYNKLGQGSTKSSLREIVEDILETQKGLAGKTALLEQATDSIVTKANEYIQKIGIVRFNPFADTGGAQSFTIAFLDKKNNGVVMTSLYARAGNRWYVKEIRNAEGKEQELSKEEVKAISIAA